MFQFGYTFNELRRRLGRTLATARRGALGPTLVSALGRAAGVGLLIGIIGVSQGLDQAQAKVLAPLSSIGTDGVVTRVGGAADGSAAAAPASSASAPRRTRVQPRRLLLRRIRRPPRARIVASSSEGRPPTTRTSTFKTSTL